MQVLSSDLDLYLHRLLVCFIFYFCVHVCLFVWSFVLCFCPVFMFDLDHSWPDDYICAVRSVYSYPFRPGKTLFLTFLKWCMRKSRALSMYIKAGMLSLSLSLMMKGHVRLRIGQFGGRDDQSENRDKRKDWRDAVKCWILSSSQNNSLAV